MELEEATYRDNQAPLVIVSEPEWRRRTPCPAPRALSRFAAAACLRHTLPLPENLETLLFDWVLSVVGRSAARRRLKPAAGHEGVQRPEPWALRYAERHPRPGSADPELASGAGW